MSSSKINDMSMEQICKDFEHIAESYYEGDFAKYEDGTYVSAQQQDDFAFFQDGYTSGYRFAMGLK